MQIRLPKSASEWTALVAGVGVIAQAVGISVPQSMRAEANKKAAWQLSDELREEKAERRLYQCKFEVCLGVGEMEECDIPTLPGESP